MGNADALSRLPVEEPSDIVERNINLVETNQYVNLNNKMLVQETMKDPVLSKVMKCLQSNHHLPQDCKPYSDIILELSVENGIILRGGRVVVPSSLREKVVNVLHADHQGIVKSKLLSRSYFWFPLMDKAIENSVKACETCNINSNNPK